MNAEDQKLLSQIVEEPYIHLHHLGLKNDFYPGGRRSSAELDRHELVELEARLETFP